MEGLAANDRSLVEGAGLLLTPPDTRSNTQRIYVPRQAIQSLEVVSLIGAAGRNGPSPQNAPANSLICLAAMGEQANNEMRLEDRSRRFRQSRRLVMRLMLRRHRFEQAAVIVGGQAQNAFLK